jgi:16S rRNA (guanine966-N2)-methyltransferase
VRIVAGTRKGHRIAAPKGTATRPTGDRVREAAFNLVGPVDDAVVLDLFAGSGAMGLEALSRGARRCVFVESDRAACRVIAANLEKLCLSVALVLNRDAIQVLREERAAGRQYDLLLVDPPYGEWGRLEGTLGGLLPSVLAADGMLLVETDSRTEPLLPLDLVTSRRYGSARLTLFHRG